MEEELLRQILQELQSQSGTNWLDFLQLMIPAIVGLLAGILGAGVGIYSVKRSSESQLHALRLTTKADVDKISLERSLDWRRDRYLELQNALAEFIAAFDTKLEAQRRHAKATFITVADEATYLDILVNCQTRLEEVRISGHLSEGRYKVENQEIGDLVLTLIRDSEEQYLDMFRFVFDALAEFRNSGTTPGNGTAYWPEEHEAQRLDIAKRTHHISKLIEERISLSD